MKLLLTILLMFRLAASVSATEQMPDIIQYEEQTCVFDTTWEHPSPLQVYFLNSGKKYPFKMLHTANYRGHVATWELKNDTLYLVEINVNKDKVDMSRIFPGIKSKDRIKASWFTGIAWVKTGRYKKEYPNGTHAIMYKNYVFLRFKQGKVEKKLVLPSKEYWEAVREYFKRRKTDTPIKQGPIFEYARYIQSFRKKKDPQDKKDAGNGK